WRETTVLALWRPDLTVIHALIPTHAKVPQARIVMLTTFNGDVDIQRALKAGAYGYMLKSSPRKELIETIRKVHSGKKSVPPDVAAHLVEHWTGESLTEREIDVLRQIVEGNRNKD